MSKTIADARDSIYRFMLEAEKCAKQELGYAAMSTVFSVILSISEAVGTFEGKLTGSVDDKSLVKNFVSRMNDKTWLISRKPTTQLSDDDVATDLYHVRNGLVHQLSLPDYVGLINTKHEVKEFMGVESNLMRVICVVDFIEVVKITVDEIIKNYPNAILDPNPEGVKRSPGRRVILPSGTSGSPGG